MIIEELTYGVIPMEKIVTEYKQSFLKYLKSVYELLRIKEKAGSGKSVQKTVAFERSLSNGMSNLFGIKLWLREKLDEP